MTQRILIGVIVAIIGGLIGCSVLPDIAPRHKWSEEWGPMVPHQTFPHDCSICHVPDRWDVIKEDFSFDHGGETGYPLQGAHVDAACLRCHNDRGPVAAYLARGCGGCHADPHKSAFGPRCTDCHVEMSWDPTGLVIEHHATRLPLVGGHAFVPCESCHRRATTGDYRGAPTQCQLCHQRDAIRAQPNHVINGWIRGCDDCHDVGDWRAVDFVHDRFPLEGGHAGVDCTACHAGGQIAGTPTDCYGCHRQDYIATGTHVPQGFSTNCLECHDTNAWR
ncbi:MAG: hypothetical protein RL885_24365 [Planctomycetota bacterium]